MANDNISVKKNQNIKTRTWTRTPNPELNAEVKKLYSSGKYSYYQLSRLFDLSPQRIQQIVKKPTRITNESV